jgi:DNA-binding transcriptional LysR family regulator
MWKRAEAPSIPVPDTDLGNTVSMALGSSDLNLLLALKVLLEEGNVTRAGRRLELSQPAMSASLARLRRKFDDELLTRTGRDYELTPLAQQLLPEVQHALRLMGKALRVEDAFDPASSERTFRLAMSDYAIAVLHEPLLARVNRLAPGVRLRIDPLAPDARSSDRILLKYDAIIAPLGMGFRGESRPFWQDRMVCLVDASHPSLRDGRLTLDDLRELPHAVASFGPGVLTAVDRVFGELGIGRRIQVSVAGFLPLPFVVEGTDLVAVLPEALARIHVGEGRSLVLVEPPFERVVLAEGYWFGHDRLEDPAHQWLFSRFEEIAEVLAQGLR